MPRIAPVVSQNHDLPNPFATSANAPVALDGYLSRSKVLSYGRLSARQREILAMICFVWSQKTGSGRMPK